MALEAVKGVGTVSELVAEYGVQPRAIVYLNQIETGQQGQRVA